MVSMAEFGDACTCGYALMLTSVLAARIIYGRDCPLKNYIVTPLMSAVIFTVIVGLSGAFDGVFSPQVLDAVLSLAGRLWYMVNMLIGFASLCMVAVAALIVEHRTRRDIPNSPVGYRSSNRDNIVTGPMDIRRF